MKIEENETCTNEVPLFPRARSSISTNQFTKVPESMPAEWWIIIRLPLAYSSSISFVNGDVFHLRFRILCLFSFHVFAFEISFLERQKNANFAFIPTGSEVLRFSRDTALYAIVLDIGTLRVPHKEMIRVFGKVPTHMSKMHNVVELSIRETETQSPVDVDSFALPVVTSRILENPDTDKRISYWEQWTSSLQSSIRVSFAV